MSVLANDPEKRGTLTAPGTPTGARWMCAATTVPSMLDHFVRKQTVSRWGLTIRIIGATAFGSPQTVGGAQSAVASWFPVRTSRNTPVADPAAEIGATMAARSASAARRGRSRRSRRTGDLLDAGPGGELAPMTLRRFR